MSIGFVLMKEAFHHSVSEGSTRHRAQGVALSSTDTLYCTFTCLFPPIDFHRVKIQVEKESRFDIGYDVNYVVASHQI